MSTLAQATSPSVPAPVMQRYEADLLGNIQQALAGLQGFDIMALELVQNADDAGATAMRFDVREDGLHVWNSEHFSSCGLTETTCPHLATGNAEGITRPCNFHAISRMGSRSKINVGHQIGRFGIGFVSVYQVTDSPVIRSRDLQMRLDPLNSESPTHRIPEVDGTEFELAWASSQSATRNALNASPTPEDVCERVAAQIRDIMDRGLFFLRRLKRIELLVDGTLVHAVSIGRDGDVLKLTKEPDGSEESWLVLKTDAAVRAEELDLRSRFPMLVELNRSAAVTVAIPLDDRPCEGLLYAYLPTEQSSRLPMHVNADFFPHPNRRAIVLTGEQHDRYWNELLLEAAATAIAENFVMLSGQIGARRLWEIGSSALALKGEGAFAIFWNRFAAAAQGYDCSWSVEDEWCPIASSHLPPEPMPAEQQAEFAAIGLDILHPDLRPHWTALYTLGAKPLRLNATIDALAQAYGAADPAPPPPTPTLLGAIDSIVEAGIKTPGAESALARLRAVRFAPGQDGRLHSLAELRIPPAGATAEQVNAIVPEVVFAHAALAGRASLLPLIPRYGFAEFADHLAERIETEADAMDVIGASAHRVRAFYELLVATAGGDGDVDGRAIVDTPILRTRSGFTSPGRGLLPGGFDDPIGHLAVVDVAAMPAPMLALAQSALGVETLSFCDYVRKHLADILAAGPTQFQYRSLMREVAQHWRELAAGGALATLGQMRFVRNRAGGYSRAPDVYFFSAALEAALDPEPERWVDENWLPADDSRARLRDLLESELGLPRRATVDHLVDRIELLAGGEPDDESAKRLNRVTRHLVERLPSMSDAERSDLERLRDLEWLPASLDGQREEAWYAPNEVYRPFRAAGFASQACVPDLQVLRSTQVRGLTDFLDFLEMPDEPPTSVAVAHLRHCMANDIQPSDIAYQILSERVEGSAVSLEPLRGSAFIYVAAENRWLTADEVFWEAPPFRGRWHAASQNMHLRSPLYRHLGVSDRPEPRHYARMLVQLADEGDLDADDLVVQDRCLAAIAEAVESGALTQQALRDEVGSHPILANLHGEGILPEDAVWSDAEWLASPFGGALDDQLVSTPTCPRGSAARLFRALGVPRLSTVARLRLATDPDNRESKVVTERVAERADLLLWLAPTASGRERLLHALLDLEVRLTDTLHVQAELLTSDPPTRSAAAPVTAFYEADDNVLHMREAAGVPLDWSAAFRDLFAQLDTVPYDADVRPVIMAAVYVIGAASAAEAEQSLRTADYSPPPLHEGREGERGEAIDDLEALGENEGAEEPADIVDEEPDARDIPEDAVAADYADHDGEVHVEDDEEDPNDGEEDRRDDGDADRRGWTGGSGQSGAGGGGGYGRHGGGPTKSGSRTGSGLGSRTGSGAGSPGSGRTGTSRVGSGTDSQQEGQTRRSRLLAYVVSTKNPTQDSGGGNDRARAEAAKIDIAAIEAVLKYERNANRIPVEQSHSNPGFDIRSAHEDGAGTRLIEVKGLGSAWNERGIKLTGVQYEMAREHPEQFWIYVVENACDLQTQKVHAIANPFSKVAEYWFDHGWRGMAEETGGARQLNLVAGVKLRHRVWGLGTVLSVERRGAGDFVLIEFPIEGRKSIPFNSMLTFVE
ncbi:protein NO VEIN domain-containing protein [Methylobacterium sp. CM6244]